MRRSVLLLMTFLCLLAVMFANDKGKQVEMTGTICNSACVVQHGNIPTCDTSCTDKSGDTVLVGDSGKVKKIENPERAMPLMGKRVKVMVVPTEKEREESLRIMEISTMY